MDYKWKCTLKVNKNASNLCNENGDVMSEFHCKSYKIVIPLEEIKAPSSMVTDLAIVALYIGVTFDLI